MGDAQDKVVHPFFVKPHGTIISLDAASLCLSINPCLVPASKPSLNADAPSSKSPTNAVTPSSKSPINAVTPSSGQLSLNTEALSSTDHTIPGSDESSTLSGTPLEPVSTNARTTRLRGVKAKPDISPPLDTTPRKRRKLSLDHDALTSNRGSEDMLPQPSSPASMPSSHPGNSQPLQADMIPSQESLPKSRDPQPDLPPKKMLRLSTGGTLVSPSSKPLPPKEDIPTKKPARRGRPKKEKPQLVVVLRYAPNHDLGHRMTRIMDGTELFELPKPKSMAPPPKPKRPKHDPSKPTHPFFSGKRGDNVSTSTASLNTTASTSSNPIQSPRRPSAVTPGKLRAQARENALKNPEGSATLPQFGASKDRSIVKQSGMVEAPFPSKGFAHVRGEYYYHTNLVEEHVSNTVLCSAGKLKHKVSLLDPSESALTHLGRSLDYHQRDTPRSDGFHDPPPALRVPTRHLVPGSQIQKWITKELQTDPSMDELQPARSVHPACQVLFDELPNKLTPFDEGRSEVQAWAQKYSPKTAIQVLQTGREATYLRDWMKTLTISAVDTTGSQGSNLDKADRERRPKKKRRKKTAELDDFIVNDDEQYGDDGELVELNTGVRHGQAKPSLTRNIDLRDPSSRSTITNSMVVTGPSGCGKTAMIHAAAKELGFEIFEINPGSRRSGKDVLDKIGDMVENHLVQKRSLDAGNTSADEDAGRLSDAFNKDLESGRQGTMKSFFTSKPTPAPQPKPKPKEKNSKSTISEIQKVLSSAKPARGQKQSLILLEEGDVMFEEDKNFWPTIFTLLQNSRRPVIMTCNDEDLVPLHAINYQGLLRLAAPPLEMAVDYMLLLAANEGHLLYRGAISALYDAKHHDLRASIAELQLWCQMGVGDPRGGLSWIYQRWPSGSGLDQHGQPIRVVSENTYHAGMGFVANEDDSGLEGSHEDDLHKELWDGWNIDPRDSLFARIASTDTPDGTSDDSQLRIDRLKQYSSISDVLSDLDTFCCIGLPGNNNSTVDATQPELPEKTRTSYIHGMALLQTPQLVDYNELDTQLAITCSRLASKMLCVSQDISPSSIVRLVVDAHSPSHELHHLTRADISSAFDTVATIMSTPTSGPPSMIYSVLDGPLHTVVTDVAPYIRSIAAYDLALESYRLKLQGSSQGSGSGGGAGVKRARTTRAARSALEGGQRQLTRRERWFDPNFDLDLAMRTAGDWPRFEEKIVAASLQSPDADSQMQVD
jgi:hypothetical protein